MIILTTGITIDVLLVFVLAEYRIKKRFIMDDIIRWRIFHMEDPGDGKHGAGAHTDVCIASPAN
jgi:hypothetical protein